MADTLIGGTGIPGSSIDAANGLVGLAPTGTGVALTIKGDSHGNSGITLLPNSGSSSDGHVEEIVSGNGGAINIYGKNPTGTAQLLVEGYSGAGNGNEVLITASPSNARIAVQTDLLNSSVIIQSSSVTDITLLDASGASIDIQPALGIQSSQYVVASLPAGQEGYIAYATNGRKVGEGSGAGTGVPVYFSNGAWRVFSTDAAVTA